jgi:hypothetical protein
VKGIELAPAHPVNHLAVRTGRYHPYGSRPIASPAKAEITIRGYGLPIDAVQCERDEERPDLVIKPPDIGDEVGLSEWAPGDFNAAEPVGISAPDSNINRQATVKPLTFGAPLSAVSMPGRVLRRKLQGPANRIVVTARRVPLIIDVICSDAGDAVAVISEVALPHVHIFRGEPAGRDIAQRPPAETHIAAEDRVGVLEGLAIAGT